MLKNKQKVVHDVGRVFNQPITLQKKVVTTDRYGVQQESWQDGMTVWAETKNLFGKEYFLAKQVGKEETIKFIIRFVPGLTEQMRIIFNGRAFGIDYIDNIKYGNRLLEIKATEVVGI